MDVGNNYGRFAVSVPTMRRLASLLLITALAGTTLGGCGGSGGSGGGTVVTPTPSPSSSPAPSPSPSSSPSPSPTPPAGPATGSDFFSSIAQLYVTQPDLTSCTAGELKPEVKARALYVLNDIRAEHDLPPVAYAESDDPGTQQSSLMQAANGQLSHNPPPSWNCYSALGATVSGQSNLFGGQGSGLRYISNDDLMIGWLTDVNNLVADSVGHRRWLLYPFLKTVSYGRVAGRYQTSSRADASALKVINSTTARPAGLPPIVAYPFEDYPARYFAAGALFSFSVIADPSTPFGANASVDYTAATISVQQRGGAAMSVSQVRYDNDGYGLPNNLQFAVAGVQNNVTYDVTIAKVGVGGSQKSYTYYFRLVP